MNVLKSFVSKKTALRGGLLLLVLFVSVQAFSQNQIRRYALVVGANNGGSERVLLKYAVSDAAEFRKVMVELGGVEEDSAFVLYNPDKRNFYSALNKMYNKIKEEKGDYRKTELFFYYSGHSDATGILLGEEKISYKELKEDIKKFDVDVRIAILDSCSSGAFTRTKGGTVQPSFFVDSSYDMKGNAFMTSSSANEASQESDRLKGSFFTHYIVSGMRGAADVSQDKKITLNEVYQFAYNSTLSRTQKTTGGPQHPNYHIEMIGTGDVVMTDVNRGSSRLIVGDSVEGKIYVRDQNERLVAEFNKSYGQEMVIALGAGTYTVINNSYDDLVSEAEISLGSDESYTLDENHFSKGRRESTRERGTVIENEGSDQNSRNDFFERMESNLDNLFDEDSGGGEYLLRSGHMTFSGYGGPSVMFGRINDQTAVYVGGKGGVIINNSFVLGAGGYGLVAPLKTETLTGNQQVPDDDRYTFLGFGGFLCEYYLFPKKLVTYSAGLLIGGGSLYYADSEAEEDYADESGTTFFATHPELCVLVNFARFFRMGAGVGYLYTKGIHDDYYYSGDINSLTFNIEFQFGWF